MSAHAQCSTYCPSRRWNTRCRNLIRLALAVRLRPELSELRRREE
jgi:hypothetical protein